ncbi:MAG: riboflavin synthase [Deltaproteobacteria bacterium]|jgi:riboflavin synthase|nr:riboflavin synthase [Deltaproteobacteria bacterium]
MFTGLILGLGEIIRVESQGVDLCISIRPKFTFDSPLILGESIAVSGVCLTVTQIAKEDFSFSAFASRETLSLTSLKTLKVVNLERALRLTDRLGGHLVSGHVDGIGSLEKVIPVGKSLTHSYSFPLPLSDFIAPKGSIAIDGVSLTVNEVDPKKGLFTVNLIPETLGNTTLSSLHAGAKVNLETDLLAKYAVNYLKGLGSKEGMTLEKLSLLGF